MDNKQKVLIAVLVAVVALFVVAIAIRGGSGGEGDASAVSSDRDGLLARLGGDPAAVRPEEIGGDCGRQGLQVVVNGSCDLRVGPSEQRMRVVRLRTAADIDVTAPAPEDADFEIEKELAAGDEVAVAVDSGGASIELDCGFNQQCTLTLLGSET